MEVDVENSDGCVMPEATGTFTSGWGDSVSGRNVLRFTGCGRIVHSHKWEDYVVG